MGIYSVTKDVGGRAIPGPMVVVAPFAMQSDAALPRSLADVLSAFITQEREGVHLYKVVARRAVREEWKQVYEAFGLETARHVQIYEDLIRELGGDPMYVSPMARLVCFRATKLLEAGLLGGSWDGASSELADLESVLLAEQRCHDNWKLVGQLGQSLSDEAMQTAVAKAYHLVQAEEDKHLQWCRDTFEAAMLEQALGLPSHRARSAASAE